MGRPCARHRNFPLMATGLKALRGPLFGEGALGDSDLCLPGGGDGNAIKTALGLQPLHA